MSGFETTVNKQQLLTALRNNRDKHQTMLKEALEGFLKDAEAMFNRKLDYIRQGIITNLNVTLSPPEDHTKEYDRAIAMMEWNTAQEVTLSEQQFICYVLDDWGWLQRWLINNRRYSQTAMQYAQEKQFTD